MDHKGGGAAFLFVSLNIHNVMVVVIVEFVGILLTTVTYIHIYRVVRHHQNQIHSQLKHQKAQAMELFREKKSALNAVHFYVIFAACYLPHFSSVKLLITDSSQNFCLVGYVLYGLLRSSIFVVKPSRLLLAISRNSSNYEKHSEKYIPHH